MITAKQEDTDFKVRWMQMGAHVYCSLFSRPRSQVTWQKCGNFIIGEEAFASLALLFDMEPST